MDECKPPLTGTIMQNTYDELWCLMDWACPGSLGSLKDFKVRRCRLTL